MNIEEVNAAAKAEGLSYGQYVNQTEAPVTPRPTEDPAEEPVDGEERNCPQCGKTFLVDLNDGRKKKQVYCSKECGNAAGQARMKARRKAAVSAPSQQEAKSDAGKAKLRLVPTRIIFDIARIREYGNAKYGDPDNWKTVEPERYRDAAFRHLLDYLADPAGTDEESGLPHLWHLACNIAFLCEMEEGL